MHDEDQGTLQAVEDGEDVCDRRHPLAEQEGSKHPHQSQYAHLGDGGDCESSAGRNDKSDRWDLEENADGDFSFVTQMLPASAKNP